MLARLVRNPVLIAAGAGAVLILGSASAVLAQVGPTPGVTPSDSASPSAPPPLAIKLGRTDNKTGDVPTGTPVPMAADVTAGAGALTNVKVTFSVDNPDATVTPDDGTAGCDATGCMFTGMAANTTKTVPLTLDIKTASGTIKVTATASADAVPAVTTDPPVTFTVSDPDPNGGGTNGGGTNGGGTGGGGTGGKTGGGKTGGTTGGTKGGSTGGTNGGGSNNTTGGSTGNVPQSGTLPPPSATGVTPPSTAPSPGAVLPSIAASPPATAGDPRALNAGNSQSMRGQAADPDELTFNKLASTQAAWLAALLVAFSLLLTQVRLGKTANRANPLVGVQRRLRRRIRRPGSH